MANYGFCVTQHDTTELIYLTGGDLHNKAWSYDFRTDTYTSLEPMKEIRCHHNCAIYHDEQKLVAAGGYTSQWLLSNTAEVYDIGKNNKLS